MLKIFNNLLPFFENNYQRIHVREYARLTRMSPPTASKRLDGFAKEKLLKKEVDEPYVFYFANKESDLFIDLLRIFWKKKFEKNGLLDFLEKEFLSPIIILFGSLAKAEAKHDSDIDLVLFTPTKKEASLSVYEQKLGRSIHLFVFKNREAVKNKELLNNILNGYKLRGEW